MSYLLHDASFSLGEGDVSTGLVLDELDLNLSALSSAFLIVIVIIVTCHGRSRSLGASGVDAIASQIVSGRRVVEASRGVEVVRHDVGLPN